MGRDRNYSPFFQEFKSSASRFMAEFSDASAKFERETSSGKKKASHSTIDKLAKLNTDTSIIEKFALALDEQRTKLQHNLRNIKAPEYLRKVEAELARIYKEYIQANHLNPNRIPQKTLLEHFKSLNASGQSSHLGKKIVHTPEQDRKQIKELLRQSRKLSRDHVKDSELSDIFFNIHKKITKEHYTILKAGAAIGVIGAIIAMSVELSEHYLGKSDPFNNEVHKTDTDTEIGEGGGSDDGGGMEGGESGDGNQYENGTEFVSQSQTIHAINYAMLVLMIIIAALLLAYIITSICAEIEQHRQASKNADQALGEKMHNHGKQTEAVNAERVKLLEDIDRDINTKSRS